MEMEQQREWAEAQEITFSIDLIHAAKKLMKFLTVVDRNRHLYDGPGLKRAIDRYNVCWLPLLAKHVESPITQGPLVVPLDCEWIWHVHRLNPIRYKFDCEKLFGRILDNCNVISTIETTSKSETKEIWNKLYPNEPFELDMSTPFSEDMLQSSDGKFTDYDLVAAVKRQISFANQTYRPYTFDDLFLKESLARYKGFLHLIRINANKGINLPCAPTFDIDLIWHAHQLHPDSYFKDINEIMAMMLQHNDSVNDRRKGQRLDIAGVATTRKWEETFGLRYWKAGGMHTGTAPTPVTQVPIQLNTDVMKFDASFKCLKPIQFPMVKAIEVMLEFTEIKNVPKEYKGNNLIVSFNKKQSDKILNIKRSLTIFSETGFKQAASFQCEPIGDFFIELIYNPSSDEMTQNSEKLLGSCTLSLQELLASGSQLMTDKWIELDIVSEIENDDEPVSLHVYISFTPPISAPHVLHLVQCHPLLESDSVLDCDGKVLFNLQMSKIVDESTKCESNQFNEVYYIIESGEKQVLARFIDCSWYVFGTEGSFKLHKMSGHDEILFELVGYKMVRFFCGRRLEFEPIRQRGTQRLDQDFVTAVEFSLDYPYGKAVALIDINSKSIKATNEWIILPSIFMTFIMSSDIIQIEKENTKENDCKKIVVDSEKENTPKAETFNNSCIGNCSQCLVDCILCASQVIEAYHESEVKTSGDDKGECNLFNCMTKVACSIVRDPEIVTSWDYIDICKTLI